MNIAVLSDIHGNYVALQAVIDYAINQGADTFVFLGDYVGELAYPQKTMEMLYSLREKYKCFFIRGNKEDYWLKYRAKSITPALPMSLSGRTKTENFKRKAAASA